MNDLIIAGVIVAAIVGGGLLMLGGIPGFGGAFQTLTRADITQVMVLWELEFDLEEGCNNISGTWHDEDDWWGCADADFPDTTHCYNELAMIAEEMCEGMNAVWTCDMNDAYCKYE